jgi:hypothetical protein
MSQRILDLLTLIGTTLLRGVDAFWAAVAFITATPERRLPLSPPENTLHPHETH